MLSDPIMGRQGNNKTIENIWDILNETLNIQICAGEMHLYVQQGTHDILCHGPSP